MRSVAQVVGVLVIAYLMGIHLTVNPLRILGAMAVVVLGSAFFACLSMTLAGLVRNRDRLMGIGQAITMPLFFASNALVPGRRDAAVAALALGRQPASYEVNALRALLLGTPGNTLLDVGSAAWSPPSSASLAASALLRRLVRLVTRYFGADRS